jgi:hypothetical protein
VSLSPVWQWLLQPNRPKELHWMSVSLVILITFVITNPMQILIALAILLAVVMVLGLLKNAMSSRMVVIAIVFFKTVIINMIYLRVFIIILIRVGLTFDIWESRSLQGGGGFDIKF